MRYGSTLSLTILEKVFAKNEEPTLRRVVTCVCRRNILSRHPIRCRKPKFLPSKFTPELNLRKSRSRASFRPGKKDDRCTARGSMDAIGTQRRVTIYGYNLLEITNPPLTCPDRGTRFAFVSINSKDEIWARLWSAKV